MASRHFPRKGERFVNGEWVGEDEVPSVPVPVPEVKRIRPTMTAADRRNWLRKKAGWPVKEG